MNEDAELLYRYATEHSEAAFSDLIRRHVDLVYSAALRLVGGDAHRAQDLTQQVFVELSRQAKYLVKHPALVGWLYTTTRRMALHSIRTDSRRSAREQEAMAMNNILQDATPETDWDQLSAVLDDVMHELGEGDRLALLLRFFQNKSLRQVGTSLGLSENAARMRVDRALDKLRTRLARKGITSTAAALALALTGNAVTAAPPAFVATLAGAALASAAAGTGTTLTLLKLMTMTKIQTGLIGALVVAGVATPLVVQHQKQIKLRHENDSLRQQVSQLAELTTANERLSNQLAQATSSQSPPDAQLTELLRLRAEVARLREQNIETKQGQSFGNLSPEQRAALARLRSSGSLGDALTALDTLRRMSPAPEVLPELAHIVKENRYAARAIGNGDGLTVIAGGENAKVDIAFRPLLQDSNLNVRQAAASVLAQIFRERAGPDVIRVSIEGLNSVDEDTAVAALATLSNAGQDHNDRMLRVTKASLGDATGDATAALLEIVSNSRREDVRDLAMRLLSGLNPDLSQMDPAMQARFKEEEQIRAFTERVNARQATLPEIIAGLEHYPKAAPAAANMLAQMGPEAQSALPALEKALGALAPSPNATGADRGAAYRAREQVVNAIQKIAPGQPKALFTQSDVRSIMAILQSPDIRADADRFQRVSTARRSALGGTSVPGMEATREQIQRLLDALRSADEPTYEAAAAQVRKIDPYFFANPTH